jgi:hypothetical protein
MRREDKDNFSSAVSRCSDGLFDGDGGSVAMRAERSLMRGAEVTGGGEKDWLI